MKRLSGKNAPENGFTLVELVVILVLLGLLAFTVVPRYLDKGVADVYVQAEQFANDIRYTQSLAMASGGRNRINLAATSYQITTSAGAPVTHPATGSPAAIPLSNVSIAHALPNGYIAFDAKGIPYSDVAGTALAVNATITLTSTSGAVRQITISPQTGRVVVQ